MNTDPESTILLTIHGGPNDGQTYHEPRAMVEEAHRESPIPELNATGAICGKIHISKPENGHATGTFQAFTPSEHSNLELFL